mmetsp:Transcript_16916/g.43443  ORF Transcript_16916/g.43443 Transcript_16916/m.43443 type:complete len:574 (+) Transcript_16916:140-1861(+)
MSRSVGTQLLLLLFFVVTVQNGNGLPASSANATLCRELSSKSNVRALHGKFCHELPSGSCSKVYIKNGRVYRFCLEPLQANVSEACRGGVSFECDEHMRRREAHLQHGDWKPGSAPEETFWDAWLSRGLHASQNNPFATDFAQRLKANRTFQFRSLLLRGKQQSQIDALDVGAGPLTGFGHHLHPSGKAGSQALSLQVIAVDPLGRTYDALLAKHGIRPLVRTQAVMGERLERVFGRDKFDFAFSVNALDHSMDPLRVLRQMIRVVKPGRHVYIQTYANEAHMGHYSGFHKWNFAYLCESGDARRCRYTLWARGRSQIDVHAELASELDFVQCNRDAAVSHRLDYRADSVLWNKTISVCCVLRKKPGPRTAVTIEGERASSADGIADRLAACNCRSQPGHRVQRHHSCPLWSEANAIPATEVAVKCSGVLPLWSEMTSGHSRSPWVSPVGKCGNPLRPRHLRASPPPPGASPPPSVSRGMRIRRRSPSSLQRNSLDTHHQLQAPLLTGQHANLVLHTSKQSATDVGAGSAQASGSWTTLVYGLAVAAALLLAYIAGRLHTSPAVTGYTIRVDP